MGLINGSVDEILFFCLTSDWIVLGNIELRCNIWVLDEFETRDNICYLNVTMGYGIQIIKTNWSARYELYYGDYRL